MKKISLLLALFTIGFTYAQSPLEEGSLQANAGLGFSGWGTPIYAGLEYGVAPNISVGGELSFQKYNHGNGTSSNFKSSIFGIQANGNYHFNEVFEIPSQWDLYAGANLNYFNWSTKVNGSTVDYSGADNFGIGLQVGGRYFFDDNFAINLQVGGGNVVSSGRIGITYKL
ncbi:outer membrane beta-barrel protein [Maribacter ulvicola]|uniref:Outer membrane protein beta-barrel domain-containing protein n=1 Tax=Maribacter ulvicola TaxID=228959 RepID=A0A1N6Q3I9_9FLAO|nr:outer membrane beta-barrel protein [Maribacter ulvicola]SIQ11143.1 Outer membrane protein beta-barrel domain-containing protein [Maribacter ulvicola]